MSSPQRTVTDRVKALGYRLGFAPYGGDEFWVKREDVLLILREERVDDMRAALHEAVNELEPREGTTWAERGRSAYDGLKLWAELNGGM